VVFFQQPTPNRVYLVSVPPSYPNVTKTIYVNAPSTTVDVFDAKVSPANPSRHVLLLLGMKGMKEKDKVEGAEEREWAQYR
jgi:hypothetical protein